MNNINNRNKNLNIIYSLIVFLFTSSLLLLIPIDNQFKLKETNINSPSLSEPVK